MKTTWDNFQELIDKKAECNTEYFALLKRYYSFLNGQDSLGGAELLDAMKRVLELRQMVNTLKEDVDGDDNLRFVVSHLEKLLSHTNEPQSPIVEVDGPAGPPGTPLETESGATGSTGS